MKPKILLAGLLIVAASSGGKNPATFTSLTQLKVLYATVMDKHKNSVTSLKGRCELHRGGFRSGTENRVGRVCADSHMEDQAVSGPSKGASTSEIEPAGVRSKQGSDGGEGV